MPKRATTTAASPEDVEAGRAPTPEEQRVSTTMTPHPSSLGADNPIEHHYSRRSTRAAAGGDDGGQEEEEEDESVYDRLAPRRKMLVVALLSFCSFLAPVSSTSVLAATPEVAAEYGSTGTVINASNAVYMLMMGLSPIVWGPLSEVYGRKLVSGFVSWLACSSAREKEAELGSFGKSGDG